MRHEDTAESKCAVLGIAHCGIVSAVYTPLVSPCIDRVLEPLSSDLSSF